MLHKSLTYFLGQCIYLAENQDEYSVVNSALEAIATMVGEIGPKSMVSPDMPNVILTLIRKVLHKKVII